MDLLRATCDMVTTADADPSAADCRRGHAPASQQSKGGLRPVPGLLQPEGRKGLLPAALHERAGLRHVG